MKLPAVELQTDDGEHEDGEEQKKAYLEQRDHRLHDGLQHNLQAWKYSQRTRQKTKVFKRKGLSPSVYWRLLIQLKVEKKLILKHVILNCVWPVFFP